MGRGVGIEEVSQVPSRADLKQSLRPQGSNIAAKTARKIADVAASDLMLQEWRRKWEVDLDVLQHEDASHDLRGQHLVEERGELLEQGKELRETRALSRANGGSGASVVDRQAQEHHQAMAVFMEDLQNWRETDDALRRRHSNLRARDKQLTREEKKRFDKRTGKPMTFPQKLKVADKAALVKMQSLFASKRSSAGSDFEQARRSMLRSAPIHEGELPAKVGKAIEGTFDEFLTILWDNWPPIDPTR
jgi:hypothetical protein